MENEKGGRSRVAGRGRASPWGERGLGQAKGAEIGKWVGRSQRDPQSIQHRQSEQISSKSVGTGEP